MKKWFLLIISISFFSFSFGQIIYHNYNPDIVVEVEDVSGDTSAYIYCDINNDSIDDFRFSLKYWYSFWTPSCNDAFSCFVSPINGQHQLGSEEDLCSIKALNIGDTIWNNLDWGGIGFILYKDGEIGCNPFDQYRYIALKIDFNSNIYYGWLKTMSYYHLEGAGSGSYAKLIISEFAYNLEPNCGLIAGDTINSLLNGMGNRLYTEENIKIYPNPVIDFLVIENADEHESLTMIDVFGKIVYKKENLQKVEKIVCENLNDGLYFITFKNSTEMYSQKVIIRKN
ncbi:MAG: T9SS type A sorting domain-containing protein [Bacteroidales bacterium]|nr:T9SS type A sorting domain-containing protein [Bacteroidales bacterium]